MNIGIISTRYARALYMLAFDEAQEDKVYTEVKCMLQQFLTFPELKRYLTSPIMNPAKKIDILRLSAGGDNISHVMKQFIDFVVRRDKQELIQFMCVAYESVYRKAKNILSTTFWSATEVDDALLGKIKLILEEAYKANIEMQVKTDPRLIGGFILDVDNNRLDASVAGELNQMKIAFKEKGV